MRTTTIDAPVSPTDRSAVRLRPLGLTAVQVTGGFWAERQRANAAVSIPEGWQQLHRAGNVQNFERAAGGGTGEAQGEVFADSDAYKWLEAAAWEIGRTGDPALLAQQRELTAIVAAAQAPDGSLDSVVQLSGMPRYGELGWSHELYCAGHLIQAAVAQRRATGDTGLLDVAVRLADHLVRTFGPDGSHELDGHPEIEPALVELYRETGTADYLDLARWFVDARGHGTIAAYGRESVYFSDRVPVRQQTSPEGHAVRAVYLAAGAADLAAEDADDALRDRLAAQFDAMSSAKQYLTGGLGARWDGEAFGDPYELPPDRAYAESCAAIGGVQWAERMLLATGDERYADQIERMLLNGMLPGVSLAGGEYFYVNALQVRGDAVPDDQRNPANGRRGWFSVACCPPNIMRTLSSFAALVGTTGDEGELRIHQYAEAHVEGAGFELDIATAYPLDGRIGITVVAAPDGAATLALRVPGWADGATVDGEPAAPGLARLTRRWSAGDRVELLLPVTPRRVVPDSRVDAVRGQVAFEVGPLVYAVEQVDQPDGQAVDDLHVDRDAVPVLGDPVEDLGGVRRLQVAGHLHGGAEPRPVTITAVPYFAWANRGAGAMRIWLPED